MILRKPYAFIIKHFKLIHLIILGCLAFCIYNFGGIQGLINTLISSRTYTYSGADIYINNIVYLFLFVALFLSVVLFWLLRQKKKPIGLYIGLIIYILAVFITYLYFYSVLGKLVKESVEVDTLSFMRDITTLVRVPGFVFLGFCFVRGVGFDIKQFNFSKDIEELKIADKDSEEFEVMVGQNNYKYVRAIRRTIRETKYYILENMLAITVLSIVLGIVLIFFGFRYYQQYMKKVKAQTVSTVNGITYVVNKAYITSKDYNGIKIKDGSKFVVIDMSFNNTNKEDKALELERFQLVNKQLLYTATQSYNSKFFDLGVPYEKDTKIPQDEMFDRYLVFEIPDTTVTTNFVLRIEYGVSSKNKNVISNYIKFDINAQNIDANNENKKVNLNEELYTNVNNENEFRITINKYSIQENYNDKYVICNRKLECNKYNSLITANNYNKKTMIVIDYKGTIYDDAKFTKTFNSFNKIFNNHVFIEYESYNQNVFENVSIVPQSDVEDKTFLLVDRKIMDSKYINLIFKFRNTTYVVPLKG